VEVEDDRSCLILSSDVFFGNELGVLDVSSLSEGLGVSVSVTKRIPLLAFVTS
jgi:hypothetical protein